MQGVIGNLKRNGFAPRTILDIGAYVGGWTEEVAGIFPDARVWMFEAQQDKKAALEAVAARVGPRVRVCNVLLGAARRDAVTYHLMETGSSVLSENTTMGRSSVSLPMTTLDDVAVGEASQSPIFLKLDVQGYELEVLKGGRSTLARSEVVLMEVSLLQYNEGAPLFRDVVDHMHQQGFVAYDVCGQSRRETDDALYQVDMVFTKPDSNLRAARKFWLKEP